MFSFVFIFIIIFNIIGCQEVSAGQWRNGTGANTLLGTYNASDIDYYTYNNMTEPLDRILSNYRRGLKVAYNSASSLNIEAGEAVVSNTAGTIRLFLKNTSTIATVWTVTTNGLDAGAEAASTTYYVYLVATNASDETGTILISTNSSTPTGATYYKKLGQFYNDGSSNIDADLVINDSDGINDSGSTVYFSNPINLGGQTASNGYLGRTTTGTTIFSNGTNVTCPTGCYITGGIKQADSNFTYFNYACP